MNNSKMLLFGALVLQIAAAALAASLLFESVYTNAFHDQVSAEMLRKLLHCQMELTNARFAKDESEKNAAVARYKDNFASVTDALDDLDTVFGGTAKEPLVKQAHELSDKWDEQAKKFIAAIVISVEDKSPGPSKTVIERKKLNEITNELLGTTDSLTESEAKVNIPITPSDRLYGVISLIGISCLLIVFSAVLRDRSTAAKP